MGWPLGRSRREPALAPGPWGRGPGLESASSTSVVLPDQHPPQRGPLAERYLCIQHAVGIQCGDVVGEESVVIKHSVLEQIVANYFTLH